MARPKKQTENLTAAQQAAKDEFRASMMQNLHLPNIPGFVFRWLNPDHRARIGMKVWAPVEATSELGKKMIEALATGQPSSIQQRGNFFLVGDDRLRALQAALAGHAVRRWRAGRFRAVFAHGACGWTSGAPVRRRVATGGQRGDDGRRASALGGGSPQPLP